ncbi:MAG: geranylgeranylglyceryl/heptaprenylglyceryl phosphate synthase [Candidatus Bathyarchaeota archaeon]|nr:MAG: geranylgeranylglyceryl/heptaprenylglyceryl phosphate synthase [Candidatus Bathyarchaeota archaeon]
MIGRVESYLLDKILKDGAIHITLIDPEKMSTSAASHTASEAEASETTAIMVGGSTIVSASDLDKTVKAIKKAVKIPVILFPNNITGISKHADAIWFMSLLNSLDPYFLIGAQVLGAPLIKKYGLEAIPLGYIVVGEGAAAGVIGRATPIPYEKPELAAAHALAARYLGMRFVYLEAGSGARQRVPDDMIRMVKSTDGGPLIVGGGIRTGEQVKQAVGAGADIIVTGTVTEESVVKDKVDELVKSIKR